MKAAIWQYRELDAVSVDRRAWTPATVRAHQKHQEPGHRGGPDHAQCDVTSHFHTPSQKSQHYKHRRHAKGAGVIHDGDQPADTRWGRIHYPRDRSVHSVAIPDNQQADEQSQHGRHQPESVATAPATLAVAHRSEYNRAPAMPPGNGGSRRLRHSQSAVHTHNPFSAQGCRSSSSIEWRIQKSGPLSAKTLPPLTYPGTRCSRSCAAPSAPRNAGKAGDPAGACWQSCCTER